MSVSNVDKIASAKDRQNKQTEASEMLELASSLECALRPFANLEGIQGPKKFVRNAILNGDHFLSTPAPIVEVLKVAKMAQKVAGALSSLSDCAKSWPEFKLPENWSRLEQRAIREWLDMTIRDLKIGEIMDNDEENDENLHHENLMMTVLEISKITPEPNGAEMCLLAEVLDSDVYEMYLRFAEESNHTRALNMMRKFANKEVQTHNLIRLSMQGSVDKEHSCRSSPTQ